MRLRILDLRLLVRKETRLEARLLGRGGGGGNHEVAVVSVPKPATDVEAAKAVLTPDACTWVPSGKCSVSGLGGRGGGAGEGGRVAPLMKGRGGADEANLVAALALESRWQYSSAKAADAKGRLFGLPERVGLRLMLLLLGKEMLTIDDGRLKAAFKEDEGEVFDEGRVGKDLVERGSQPLATVTDGDEVIGKLA